jgi:transglutaminase-like putative cysteine protease
MGEYFKQLCSAAGIPCRLVVGERAGAYYAWVEAFTNKWEAVDAYAGVKVTPAGYRVVYTEPMQEFHLLTKEKDAYE